MLMVVMIIALGVVLLGIALHPFITYPLSLSVLARLRPRPVRADREMAHRRVAICVCAYNEAAVIAARIDNLLSLRALVPSLDILVYVDAASDRTAEIVRSYGDRIQALISPVRQGKTCGMNELVSRTSAEFIVFSDANVMFAPDALPALLAPFADDQVGCVCGNLVYVTPAQATSTAETGSLYWRLEEHIKELESRSGSAMGADGSIFAIRKSLHRPPPGDLIDDMYVSLSILCQGYRVVRAGGAVAFEESVSKPGQEFRRKVRIACQAFNVHRVLQHSLLTMTPLDKYKYLSHKLIRWLTIYLLAAAAACFILACGLLGAWGMAAMLGVAMAAVFGLPFLFPIGPLAKLADIFGAFVATGLGVLRSLRGDRFQTWTPPESARSVVSLPVRELTETAAR